MSDLIKRKDAESILKLVIRGVQTSEEICKHQEFQGILVSLLNAIKTDITDLSSLDAEQVRRGRWIDDSGEGDAAICSVCGECFDTTEADTDDRKAFQLFTEVYKYCPCCGARMVKEAERCEDF